MDFYQVHVMSLIYLYKEQQLGFFIPSLISGLFIGMCGVSCWSKRYADCPPTWLSWEQVSRDQKWDKLWMREDWLSGGSQSPSQFIWHGYLGNKAARQEAGERCKPLFVWITAKKLPGLQASCSVLGGAIRVGIVVYCGARSGLYPSTNCVFSTSLLDGETITNNINYSALLVDTSGHPTCYPSSVCCAISHCTIPADIHINPS